MMKRRGFLFWLAALAVLCVLLPATAVAETDVICRKLEADEFTLNLSGLGNALAVTSQKYEDGVLSVTVDGDATDWEKLLLYTQMAERVLFPINVTSAEEYLYVTSHSGCFRSEEHMVEKIIQACDGASWAGDAMHLYGNPDVIFYHMADYIPSRNLVTPHINPDSEKPYLPVRNAQALVYCENTGTPENPYMEVREIRYLMVDLVFTPEDTGWEVGEIPRLSSRFSTVLNYKDDPDFVHSAVTVEEEVINGKAYVYIDTSDPNMPEDYWQTVQLTHLHYAPEGAVNCSPGDDGQNVNIWDWGTIFWDSIFNRPIGDYTWKLTIIWLDDEGNMMDESGVYELIVIDKANFGFEDEKPWMEYSLSDTFAKLPASRMDVEISISADAEMFTYEEKDGYTHFSVNPDYELNMQDLIDLTSEDENGWPPYSMATYWVNVPTNAKYVTTDISSYENGIGGINQNMYDRVIESLMEQPKETVSKKVELSASDFIETLSTQYPGVKLARSKMMQKEDNSGRVYFFAWFDQNEELIKVEWVCETSDEILFDVDVKTYSSFSSVPADLTAPALVDFENRGMTMTASFVPQAPEKDEEGYAGYAVQTSLENAASTYTGSEEELKNLYVFLPYYLDADRKEDMFQLVRYQDGAEEQVEFDTGTSGISFPIKSMDECTYVLKWKEDPAVDLPADLTHIEPYAFAQSSFIGVYCGDDVEKIGAYAFKDAVNLERVYIPSQAEIDETAFEGCTALKVIQSDMYGGDANELADKLEIEFQVKMR